MDLNQTINTLKRRAESICQILFYIVAGLCFIYYVGNFSGGFMPVMGTLLSMAIEVSLWLLIPVLLSVRRRSVAKWAFLGLSIFWALTTIFSLLDSAILCTTGASALSCATGVFGFLVACAMIVVSVLAPVAYWKKDSKLKIIALLVYLGTLILFLVLFSLRVALYAKWGMNWSEYFYLLYNFLVIPVAICFAALAFWFEEKELYFTVLERNTSESKSAPHKKAKKEEPKEDEDAPQIIESAPAEDEDKDAE